LNPDTTLEPLALERLIAILETDQSVGVTGPKCLYADGTPHTSYHYSWGLLHLVLWRLVPYSLTRRLYDRYAKYNAGQVGFVSGACLLIRADLYRKIGGYDPAYFLTVEDACDLCERVRDLGYRIRFSPEAQIRHLCGRSGEQVPYLTTIEGYKGDIYFFLKRRGLIQGMAAYLIVLLSCLFKAIGTGLRALILRRAVDRRNLQIYFRIFPALVARGLRIVPSVER